MNRKQATLGGGCFWCLEAVFLRVPGVVSVVSGYAGGSTDNPDYHAVCTGRTGHAEVVRIEYDADVTDFRRLLDVFFTIHDPTQLNRQGNDVGSQYRSIILTQDDEQARMARDAVAALGTQFSQPVVTEITPLERFYPAESYHQDYFQNNPGQPYCQIVVAPKVAKYEQHFGKS